MEAILGRIEREVGSWDGVTVGPHRFGGIEFRLGRRELGHLHRDGTADLAFPRAIRDMLVETGRAMPHRWLPESSLISKPIRTEDDADDAIELFRLSYERARVAALRKAASDDPIAQDTDPVDLELDDVASLKPRPAG